MHLNVTQLLSEWPSSAELRAALAAANIDPPSPEVIRAWRHRNSIPGHWLAKLLSVLASDTGRPVDLAVYMETPECPDPPLKRSPSPTGEPLSIFD
jgi:hypothetical protein